MRQRITRSRAFKASQRGRRCGLGSNVHTFEDVLPEVSDLATLSDAALVEAAGGWARAENAACARKLAVLAEMFAAAPDWPPGNALWWIDPQAAVAAEMGAAVNVSQGMALHQTHRGVALRDRLPKVAALFEQRAGQ